MALISKIINKRRIELLIENKTIYRSDSVEFQIFKTNQCINQFLLKFNRLTFVYILEGKMIMRVDKMKPFTFLTGETFIVSSNELMYIGLPEADSDHPARFLTLMVTEEKVSEVINALKEEQPKRNDKDFVIGCNFHLTNNRPIQKIIHRLLYLFSENHPSKDVFVDFMVKELIIRVLKINIKKKCHESFTQSKVHDRLSYAVQHIHQNLDQTLTIKELSEKVCLSESHFYRIFKEKFKMSPIDFINKERIKRASLLLQNPNKRIKEVALQCGFNNISYFIRVFKKIKSMTPRAYQMSTQNSHS